MTELKSCKSSRGLRIKKTVYTGKDVGINLSGARLERIAITGIS
jgi:hypothetical protein